MSINKFIEQQLKSEENDTQENSSQNAVDRSAIDFDEAHHSMVCSGCSCVCDDISYFLKDEKIIGNPYSLSNILYALNIKVDVDASKIAIDLTKEFWRSHKKQMLSSLYINMTNTFIVAGELDETLDEIINETKKILDEDSDYFNPHEYIVYENLACYHGMKNDKARSDQ